MEIFPQDTILAADEPYVGLVTRYIYPDVGLWRELLLQKRIELTQELLFGMSVLRCYMSPLQDVSTDFDYYYDCCKF